MPVWPLPPLPLLCHLTRALPLIFSFSSTFTLCLIALDRHHLIVDDGQVRPNYKLVSKPVKTKIFHNILASPPQVAGGQRGVGCMVATIAGAWALAALSASPVMAHTHLKVRYKDDKYVLQIAKWNRNQSVCFE